eukprot:IDg20296t1
MFPGLRLNSEGIEDQRSFCLASAMRIALSVAAQHLRTATAVGTDRHFDSLQRVLLPVIMCIAYSDSHRCRLSVPRRGSRLVIK